MIDHSEGTTEALIDRVLQAAASEENRHRGSLQPSMCFSLEEHICWHHIFGIDVHQYFRDPALYFSQTLRNKLWRWQSFPDDDGRITARVPASLGWYPEYTFIGLDVTYSAGGVPSIQTDHDLTHYPELRRLPRVDFYHSGWMPRVLHWYDDLVAIAGDRLPVSFDMLWQRGCLDLAVQLRGYGNLILDTKERPQFVHDLLKHLVEQRCLWYDAYHAHFGTKPSPVGIADDWVNVPFITPGVFADFVLPRYLEIEAYHGGLLGVHACGDQTPLQQYLLEIRSLPTLEVGPWTDLQQSLQNIPPTKHLHISLHPNDVLVATEEEMEHQLAEIMAACGSRSYSIGTSGLTPLSPDIHRFVGSLRTWTGIAGRLRQGG